jgi:2'-5' RNA ligase
MTDRLFVALHIPENIVEKIISIRDEIYPNDNTIKWEPKFKLHITLKFLGDTQNDLIPEICKQLENTVKEFSKLHLCFELFGIFKRKGVPKIVYAGLNNNKTLQEIVDKINIDLNLLGFEKEDRKFNPHLTLLRIKGRENLENIFSFDNYKIEKIEFVRSKISLFKSTLLKSGSVYNTIKSFELN